MLAGARFALYGGDGEARGGDISLEHEPPQSRTDADKLGTGVLGRILDTR
jgi:hypothetical protein